MDEDFGLGGAEQRDAAEPDAAPGEEDQAMLELPEGFDNRGGAAGPAGAGGEERLPVPEAMEDTVDNQVFRRALVTSISEVGNFIGEIHAEATRLGTELHPDLQQVLDYCSTFAPRRTAAAEVACRRAVQARIKHPYYVGLVLNLAPESADELMGLIPQLAPGQPGSPFASEQEIEEMISELVDNS